MDQIYLGMLDESKKIIFRKEFVDHVLKVTTHREATEGGSKYSFNAPNLPISELCTRNDHLATRIGCISQRAAAVP